ncbi:MAG: prephenate dehydratase [Anaerolineaceae bacterium]|nr:prephenate dehydratase [Anaerolineaceae bacterium]
MKAAFQGEPGAYSEEAGYSYFDQVEMIPEASFDAVFSSVTSEACQSGLIPIENSLAGSIHQNYDLLLSHNLSIVGEYFLRVRHCLIGFPGITSAEIKKVISHPQALGQCASTLKELGVQTEPVYDTAGSVKILKSSGEKTTAAIASKRAAEIYKMHIIQEGIEDNPENYTRFLEIAHQPIKPSGKAKTSIVFTLNNQPGALFKAMSVFALRDIDLTKIESRPLAGKPWEYLFYIDFIGAIDDQSTSKALAHLDEYALMLRVLGSYPVFHE